MNLLQNYDSDTSSENENENISVTEEIKPKKLENNKKNEKNHSKLPSALEMLEKTKSPDFLKIEKPKEDVFIN